MVGEEGYTVGEYDEEEENTEAAVDETDSDEIEVCGDRRRIRLGGVKHLAVNKRFPCVNAWAAGK